MFLPEGREFASVSGATCEVVKTVFERTGNRQYRFRMAYLVGFTGMPDIRHSNENRFVFLALWRVNTKKVCAP